MENKRKRKSRNQQKRISDILSHWSTKMVTTLIFSTGLWGGKKKTSTKIQNWPNQYIIVRNKYNRLIRGSLPELHLQIIGVPLTRISHMRHILQNDIQKNTSDFWLLSNLEPFCMEGSWHINPLVGMSTKIVPLSLDQISRQPFPPICVKIS